MKVNSDKKVEARVTRLKKYYTQKPISNLDIKTKEEGGDERRQRCVQDLKEGGAKPITRKVHTQKFPKNIDHIPRKCVLG